MLVGWWRGGIHLCQGSGRVWMHRLLRATGRKPSRQHQFKWLANNSHRAAVAVLSDLGPFETEVKTKSGRGLPMRLRLYRRAVDRIYSVIANFIDVTQRLTPQEGLRDSQDRYRRMVDEASAEMEALKYHNRRVSLAKAKDD